MSRRLTRGTRLYLFACLTFCALMASLPDGTRAESINLKVTYAGKTYTASSGDNSTKLTLDDEQLKALNKTS
jgi:hypothetical protein